MAYNFIIQEEAISRTREAFDWYEEQKSGLGYEFIKEVENCFEKIQNNPDHFSYLSNYYRRIKLNRFPYLIIYELEWKEITVTKSGTRNRNPSFKSDYEIRNSP